MYTIYRRAKFANITYNKKKRKKEIVNFGSLGQWQGTNYQAQINYYKQNNWQHNQAQNYMMITSFVSKAT